MRFPFITIRWGGGDQEEFVRFAQRFAPNRRTRVVFRTEDKNCVQLTRTARDLGFQRIRVEGMCEKDEIVSSLLSAGANEMALWGGKRPHPKIIDSRRAGKVLWLSCIVPPEDVLGGAIWDKFDEIVLRVATDDILRSSPKSAVSKALSLAKHVQVLGAPLCLFDGLDDTRVLSNSMTCYAPSGKLDVRFEDSERVYFALCAQCRVSLACDGFPYHLFTKQQGETVEIRSVGNNLKKARVELNLSGLSKRRHPRQFLHGMLQKLVVREGLRRCARVVVPQSAEKRVLKSLQSEGFFVRKAQTAPRDNDSCCSKVVHIFFGEEDAVLEAIRVEEGYGSSLDSADPSVFAREMGKVFGYPECCIENFAEHACQLSTREALGLVAKRSQSFDFRLACIDQHSPFLLIPHIPCMFDCHASVQQADSALALFENAFPCITETARSLLGRLFLDAGTLLVFDKARTWGDDGFSYDACDAVLLSRGLKERGASRSLGLFALGDRFRVSKGEILVYKGDEKVGSLRQIKPVVVYPFFLVQG